jgi:hypothetical protein
MRLRLNEVYCCRFLPSFLPLNPFSRLDRKNKAVPGGEVYDVIEMSLAAELFKLDSQRIRKLILLI